MRNPLRWHSIRSRISPITFTTVEINSSYYGPP
jgi:hypothetical protein